MKNSALILLFVSISSLLSFKGLIDFNDVEYKQIIESYKKPIIEWPIPTVDEGVEWREFESIQRDTAFFTTQEKPEVILGKMLFFDPKLSRSQQISCSSCHDPEMGWTDRRTVSLGHDHLQGVRNTPSLYNIGDRTVYFWDGRARTLQEQAIGPLTAPHEMAVDNLDEVVDRINQIEAYKDLFMNAYGDRDITVKRILDALAIFQQSIKSQPSRVDLFIDGKYNALTDKEIYGMHIFRTKARCMNCHFGKDLTDDSFHNIGLTYYKRKYEDLGRYVVTQNPDDVGKFRTPSLRDLLNTRPWMHNGLFDNLFGIVNIYNSGMHMIDPTEEQKLKDPLYPVTDSLMKPLGLDRFEKEAVVAFLEALSGSKFKMRRPDLPRDSTAKEEYKTL
ncbi:cytochrome-c peroxidase [Myroides albus]|uniref:cytochrome-c peroxidase n=1 Tax=Myroides albus TaxID=2562892 RepID=UPI00374497DD